MADKTDDHRSSVVAGTDPWSIGERGHKCLDTEHLQYHQCRRQRRVAQAQTSPELQAAPQSGAQTDESNQHPRPHKHT